MDTDTDTISTATDMSVLSTYGFIENLHYPMIIHDGYFYYDLLKRNGVTNTRSLIFECFIWIIRKAAFEDGFEEDELLMADDSLDHHQHILQAALSRTLDLYDSITMFNTPEGNFRDPIDNTYRRDACLNSEGCDYDDEAFTTNIARGRLNLII